MIHRLADLNPKWFTVDGRRVGITFYCPACLAGKQADEHGGRAFAFMDPPLDPGPDLGAGVAARSWRRTGDTFETLTLSPSILYRLPGPGGALVEHWHGFVTNGEVTSCG